MQQRTEIHFNELTMEVREEVSRVIRFWTRPHPNALNPEVIAKHVELTSGDFKISLVYDVDQPPGIEVLFESGFTFNFALYLWTITIDEATRLFNQFIEQNLDFANQCFIDHPEWLGFPLKEV